ncbi:UDP-phosphate galactose phosphotransferase [Rodentibacter genomosp. 1]|uniref:UDP-phosphate galactose phosphotransferase n=1 Tax=Rodentibacter genomosp. 1 TaxID=1908264 RepID=A0A1V3J6G9_9PAST|nr:undecaprenyl-phosphate galactose phosphotransferase WbaP [Rodentibacter genomosp. 1]OOF50512.1 UDP-phosphate galactose phosphotransferase [Rodentibacter genomosp. 1]
MHKNNISKLILISVDFFSLVVALFFSHFILFSVSSNPENYIPVEEKTNYLLIHFLVSLSCIIWFLIKLRHYTYRKPFWFELKEILQTLSIFFIIELSIMALSKLYISRTFWLSVWGAIFLLFPSIRILIKIILIKTGIYIKDSVIIGSGKNAEDVFQALNEEKFLGLNIHLFVSTDDSIGAKKILGVPIARHNPELLLKIVDPKFTQFILAMDEENKEKQDFWLRFLISKGCRSISVIPELRGIPLYGTDMAFLFSHEVVLFRVNNNLAKRSSKLLKRAFDIIGSIFLIIILSPIFLILYFLVKKDGSVAIYRHTRIGQFKKTFECLKFRTMKPNSSEILKNLLEHDPIAQKEWEKDFKLKNDPRITHIGRFLRETSLDELPQLWNVLKGEMSLVGPRPIVKDELAYYQDDIDYYLMAKPGMTGLWQVSGRNNVDYETRVYFDTWYAKNWSLWNDIVILFKTIKVVINRNGAY